MNQQHQTATESPFPSSWLDRWNAHSGQERSLRVRWLLNPNSEPLHGAEIVEQAGFITDIRPLQDATASDVLPLMITPPLINSHTHLEFSSLRSPLQPSSPFPDWIQSVIRWRKQTGESSTEISQQSAIATGLKESTEAGVSVIGEITTSSAAMPFDIDAGGAETSPPQVISFRECIGLNAIRFREQLDIAERHLSMPRQASVVAGISPHAPYTVHPDLLEGLIGLSQQFHAPVAMHLAETQDELQLLSSGTGRMAVFLKALGLFDSQTFPGKRSVRECLEQLSRASQVLAVHGNYFDGDDIAWLTGRPNFTVVYCPRTHAYFGHSKHPLRQLLNAGVRTVLGTDSRASNPDLNIWSELQFVAQIFPELSAGTLIAMITIAAAEGMGLNPKPFQLRAGNPFQLTLLRCSESSNIDTAIQNAKPIPMKLA